MLAKLGNLQPPHTFSPVTSAPSAPLSEAFAQWKKVVEAELKGASFDKKLVTPTFEGVALQPLYTRADLAGLANIATPPGKVPYLRGVRPFGYKDQPWAVAQEITARSAAEFNAALIGDLMGGQNNIVLKPNTPHGVTIADLADLNTALAGVDFAAVPINIVAGADALPLAAMFLELARARGFTWEKLTGSVASDPLSEWTVTGGLDTKIESCYDGLAGWTAWAAMHAPKLKTLGVNAALWGDAGGTAVHELAFALAAATEYLRALAARGISPDLASARFRFRFSIGPQFFTEVAKFRAFRPLWTRVLVAFGVPASTAVDAFVHAATGRWNKTLLDPQVNLLRVTTEALSAVLGGCDSLHIAPFDQVRGATDDFSRRIARNVHTLLAEEFNFTQTADPAGGSWYVEKLTDKLARKAWELFQVIESRGGLAAALREGYPQQLVSKAAEEKADAIGKRRLGLIGANLFPNLKEKAISAAPAITPVVQDRLYALYPALAEPPPSIGWPARLEKAFVAARSGAHIDQLVSLAHSNPTAESVIHSVVPWRASFGFETLRQASDAFAQSSGKRPRVFLAKIGPPAQHKARADFSTGFFAPGGFEIMGKQSFDTAEAAAVAALASGAPIAVLCSTDDTYPGLVPAFTAAVKTGSGDGIIVVLAGLPPDPATVTSYRAAGIDAFIHVRANLLESLTQFLQQIGAL